MNPPPSTKFDRLAYHDPRPNAALIRALGPINRHLILRWCLKLHPIHLPSADVARLRSSIRADTVAFVGPTHPEFMTDWLLDKEVSRLTSPLMAHWASFEIVNLNPWAQWFWLRNNLIANAPGGAGKEYSIRWARAGHGVLLHPEGTATWQSDRVGPLVPGIVDMAWECCRQGGAESRAPVYLVPVVWKLHFPGDVSAGLARDMATIERALGLADGRGLAVEERFAVLQWQLLQKQSERFGMVPKTSGYFDAQDAAISFLRDDLEQRYGRVEGDAWRILHLLRRAIREAAKDAATVRRDREKIDELWRLLAFPRTLYGRPLLTQEQIAENLKRTRATLVRRGFRNALHNLVPVAVGAREVQMRAPEPLAVHEAFARGGDEEQRKAELLGELRSRMQSALDRLNEEIAPRVTPYARPNPLQSISGESPDR